MSFCNPRLPSSGGQALANAWDNVPQNTGTSNMCPLEINSMGIAVYEEPAFYVYQSGRNMTPIQNPMSIPNMALLSFLILIETHSYTRMKPPRGCAWSLHFDRLIGLGNPPKSLQVPLEAYLFELQHSRVGGEGNPARKTRERRIQGSRSQESCLGCWWQTIYRPTCNHQYRLVIHLRYMIRQLYQEY